MVHQLVGIDVGVVPVQLLPLVAIVKIPENSGSGVFHSPVQEVLHRNLRIAAPGIGHAHLLLQEVHDRLAVLISRFNLLGLIRVVVQVQRHFIPGLSLLEVVVANSQHHQVGGVPMSGLVVPGFGAFSRIGFYANLPAVGKDLISAIKRHPNRCNKLIIRIVIAGDPMTVISTLPLRPDLLTATGVRLIPANEVKPLAWLS